MGKFNLEKIQNILREMNIDGWLLFDFRGSNLLAHDILDIAPNTHLTRRFYYFIPKEGSPSKIANGIEAFRFDHLPGNKLNYSSHVSLKEHLNNTLSGSKKIAMEYSPLGANPYVSRVDAGTIEFIRTFGVEIVSSGDMISMFSAVWTDDQYEDNIIAANNLYEIVDLAFNYIKENIEAGKKLNEYMVQQFIVGEFNKRKMVTDSDPIVGVNENSANPHYAPTKEVYKEINKNDFVLIDLWAKMNKPDSVMADITWTGYVGNKVPDKIKQVAQIVFDARDAAFDLMDTRFKEGKEIRGYEVDDAARSVIEKAGYGKYFIHRTGHSIYTETHGSGAHMDNFETKDERLVLRSTSNSIEPGIYLPGEFGVRSEIDVFVTKDGKVISTGKERQKEVVCILS